MLDFIEDIKDFIDSLLTWQKWLGSGIEGVILFFLFLLIFAGPSATKEIVEIPIELKEIQYYRKIVKKV